MARQQLVSDNHPHCALRTRGVLQWRRDHPCDVHDLAADMCNIMTPPHLASDEPTSADSALAGASGDPGSLTRSGPAGFLTVTPSRILVWSMSKTARPFDLRWNVESLVQNSLERVRLNNVGPPR